MSRISIAYEEDYPGQFDLWQANCMRSVRGKVGRAELSVLRDALLALPEKRLIHGELISEDGEVCALGAYARHKGLDLQLFDPEDETDAVGIAAGMPPLVAWKVVELSDYDLGRHVTPEDRYKQILAWVEKQLVGADYK